MKKQELMETVGGTATLTSIINSIVKLGSYFVEVGRSIGSAIRYKRTGKKCI